MSTRSIPTHKQIISSDTETHHQLSRQPKGQSHQSENLKLLSPTAGTNQIPNNV